MLELADCDDGDDWTILAPKDIPDIEIYMRHQRIVGFSVGNQRYQTRSGLKVGDSESRIQQLFGSDQSLTRKTQTIQSGGSSHIEYGLGTGAATSMRILLKDGSVWHIIFGSSREIHDIGLPC